MGKAFFDDTPLKNFGRGEACHEEHICISDPDQGHRFFFWIPFNAKEKHRKYFGPKIKKNVTFD